MTIMTQLELLDQQPTQLVYGPFISRKEARRQGLARFFTGRPCKHGHVSQRLTSNGRCCECHSLRQLAIYHSKTPEEKLAFNRANARSSEQRRAANLRYENKKYANNLNYRIAKCLRCRFHKALSRDQKSDRATAMIGCTIERLRNHLEAQFTDGMSWENYGKNGWHVDHIRPCASFDLTDPEQQRQCFHYTNLQPLWATDNMRKSAKWQPPEPSHPPATP